MTEELAEIIIIIMRDRYLLSLFVLLFGIGIILAFQIFFLLEKPKKSLEKKRTDALILENNELKARIKGLLAEKRGSSTQIISLIEEGKMKDEQIKLLISKKPKEVVKEVMVPDPGLAKRVLELEQEKRKLILENEYLNKAEKEIDKRITKLQEELLIKEEKIKALKAEIENKEKEKTIVLSEMQDAFQDTQNKERLESLEKEKIDLAERILSLQEEIGELSKKIEKLSSKNEIILKEGDDLKKRLVLVESEKEKVIEDSKEQIEEILKKKEEEVSKIKALKESEKKTASRKSTAGNLLSMFLLWKK